jgi:hypothetical protein
VVKTPYKDRLEFWKLQNASITFSEVKSLCNFIIEQRIVSGHPLHISLMTALHILYGRPFKQRPEVRIPEDLVPIEYKDTHDSLLNMRDKIFAHTNIDGPKTSDDYPVNKVGVSIQGGAVRFMITMLFPRDTQKICDLAKALSEKTWNDAEKIWQIHFKSEYVPDNDYEINLSKNDDAFLKSIQF